EAAGGSVEAVEGAGVGFREPGPEEGRLILGQETGAGGERPADLMRGEIVERRVGEIEGLQPPGERFELLGAEALAEEAAQPGPAAEGGALERRVGRGGEQSDEQAESERAAKLWRAARVERGAGDQYQTDEGEERGEMAQGTVGEREPQQVVAQHEIEEGDAQHQPG